MTTPMNKQRSDASAASLGGKVKLLKNYQKITYFSSASAYRSPLLKADRHRPLQILNYLVFAKSTSNVQYLTNILFGTKFKW